MTFLRNNPHLPNLSVSSHSVYEYFFINLFVFEGFQKKSKKDFGNKIKIYYVCSVIAIIIKKKQLQN